MAYEIRFTPEAERGLRQLPHGILTRMDDAILALADNPRPAGCKRLHAEKGHWRIRVGDYRIIYKITDTVLLVLVLQVGHRSVIYKKKK